jgi:hypothetical protein
MPFTAQEKIELKKKELERLQAEIDAAPGIMRKCHYRKCEKEFKTDDKRMFYCTREHYRLENNARTEERNEVNRQRKLLEHKEKKGV